MTVSFEELRQVASRVRRHCIEMSLKADAPHSGASLSVADLLAVLYYSVLRVNPDDPGWAERDRFILSKGQAAAAYYAVLAERGFFPVHWLDTFCENGSQLAGHATSGVVPGIEVSTGALGHGLSIAAGMALAAKLDEQSWRVFCLLSDGEFDEGSNWETVLFARQHSLGNLVAIVDYNGVRSPGAVKEMVDSEPFSAKWSSFGWAVRDVDGHDVRQIHAALSQAPFEANRPSCVIAHTVRGRRISCTENQLLWRHPSPQGETHEAALRPLETAQ
jgi:transketolase